MNNYKVSPFLAVLACLVMISTFSADRQIKNKNIPANCSKEAKIKNQSLQSSAIPAFYILQTWSM